MIHLIIALAMQAGFGLATGNWWIGAIAPVATFIGREHAQAEYRWIERYGLGRRANMPWWGGFDLRVWDHLDPWIDWLAPVIGTAALAAAISLF